VSGPEGCQQRAFDSHWRPTYRTERSCRRPTARGTAAAVLNATCVGRRSVLSCAVGSSVP
jgi:hypothetical protein